MGRCHGVAQAIAGCLLRLIDVAKVGRLARLSAATLVALHDWLLPTLFSCQVQEMMIAYTYLMLHKLLHSQQLLAALMMQACMACSGSSGQDGVCHQRKCVRNVTTHPQHAAQHPNTQPHCRHHHAACNSCEHHYLCTTLSSGIFSSSMYLVTACCCPPWADSA